jgi:hypothetical protein
MIDVSEWLTDEEQATTLLESIVEQVPMIRTNIQDSLNNESLIEEERETLREMLTIIDSMNVSDLMDYSEKWDRLVSIGDSLLVRYH